MDMTALLWIGELGRDRFPGEKTQLLNPDYPLPVEKL
jgi:hypothetical protein